MDSTFGEACNVIFVLVNCKELVNKPRIPRNFIFLSAITRSNETMKSNYDMTNSGITKFPI